MNCLYILFFLDFLNLAVFLPIFGPYVRLLGGTPFTVGLINSSSSFISFLWNPLVGSLSDRKGRKTLLLKCLISSLLGSVILAFSSSSLILVLLGRLVGSLGSGVGILLRSIVADIYKTPEGKTEFFTKCGPLLSVGFLLGSVSSGFISEAENGNSYCFLIMALIMTTATIITKIGLKNDHHSNDVKSKSAKSLGIFSTLKQAINDLRTGIDWKRYKNLFLLKMGYDFGLTIVFTNIGLIMLDEFEIRGRYMGLVFLTISVVGILTNLLKLKLRNLLKESDVHTKINFIIKGALVLIVAFLGMVISTSFKLFIVFLLVLCIVRSFLDSFLTELITGATNDDDRGKVLGAFENLLPLASFVVPVVSGFIAEYLGQRSIIFSAIIPMSFAVIVARRQFIHLKKE